MFSKSEIESPSLKLLTNCRNVLLKEHPLTECSYGLTFKINLISLITELLLYFFSGAIEKFIKTPGIQLNENQENTCEQSHPTSSGHPMCLDDHLQRVLQVSHLKTEERYPKYFCFIRIFNKVYIKFILSFS